VAEYDAMTDLLSVDGVTNDPLSIYNVLQVR